MKHPPFKVRAAITLASFVVLLLAMETLRDLAVGLMLLVLSVALALDWSGEAQERERKDKP